MELFLYLPPPIIPFSSEFALLAALMTLAVAGTVRGFSGFGASLISIPLLSAIYGPTVAIPSMLALEFLISIPLIAPILGHVPWPLLTKLTVTAIIGAPLGIALMTQLPPDTLRLIISAVVLLTALALSLGLRRQGPESPLGIWVVGGITGILAGLTGISGPVVVLYFLTGKSPPQQIRSTLLLFFFVINLGVLLMLFIGNTAPVSSLRLAVPLALSFVPAGILGARFFTGSSEKTYRRIAISLVGLSAIVGLIL